VRTLIELARRRFTALLLAAGAAGVVVAFALFAQGAEPVRQEATLASDDAEAVAAVGDQAAELRVLLERLEVLLRDECPALFAPYPG
jgi:hypothetical protein